MEGLGGNPACIPLHSSPGQLGPVLTPSFSRDPELGEDDTGLLSFMSPKSEVEGSSFPSDAFHCSERWDWGGAGGKCRGRQKLGDQFTFSTLRLQTKYNIFIIIKEEENLYKPR